MPDSAFEEAVDRLEGALASVGPIESLRFDPLLQNSEKRRLAFAQFERTPLYWRVDIEIFAESIGRDDSYDLDNPAARGDDWSSTHSALMNGVAALKWLLRGRDRDARESLHRAFDRIDHPVPDGPLWDQIPVLAEAVGRIDLDHAALSARRAAPREGG